MYGKECKAVEPMECGVCEPRRDTISEKAKRIGKCLEEARIVMSNIGVNMFGAQQLKVSDQKQNAWNMKWS